MFSVVCHERLWDVALAKSVDVLHDNVVVVGAKLILVLPVAPAFAHIVFADDLSKILCRSVLTCICWAGIHTRSQLMELSNPRGVVRLVVALAVVLTFVVALFFAIIALIVALALAAPLAVGLVVLFNFMRRTLQLRRCFRCRVLDSVQVLCCVGFEVADCRYFVSRQFCNLFS